MRRLYPSSGGEGDAAPSAGLDALDRRLGDRHVRHDASAIHHGDAVGEREDLLQVLADQKHRAAARAERQELAVDELGRADVDAARRLRGEQDFRLARDLAGEQRLLQIAAGERAGARLRAGGADVEALDLIGREAADGARG